MWTSIGEPPNYPWLRDNLATEHQRLCTALGELLQLRAAADQADERRATAWRLDPNKTDQSECFSAQIAALEVELEFRENLEVFLLAYEEYAAAERSKAETALLHLEAAERKRLGAEDGFPLHYVFATLPKWHAARRRRDALAPLDSSARRYNMESLRSAASDLARLRASLANEPTRTATAAAARRRDDAAAAVVSAPTLAKQSEASLRQERVEALLHK